jgi:DNA-binding LytR/AlgR family response regulator
MEKKFTVIIVEDAKLELKGTEEIFRTEIPEAEIIGVAPNERELDDLLAKSVPNLLLLDLGLGGSTTVGVDICRRVKTDYAAMKIFRRNRNEDLVLAGSGDDLEYTNDVDSVYMAEWQAFILERALEDLKNSVDTDSYQVFYMSVVQKRPVKDIAAITRKTSNNIYVIRSRCLKKLKELIAGYRQCEESELMRHSTRKS